MSCPASGFHRKLLHINGLAATAPAPNLPPDPARSPSGNRRSTANHFPRRRMESLQGRVERTRHTTHVSGTSSRTTTQHVAIFEIGDVTVTYYGADPVLIERGDEVRVVGTAHGER